MMIVWGTIAGLLLYLELVFHFSSFGWGRYNPVFNVMLIIAWSAALTMFVGVVRGKLKKIIYYSFVWIGVVWTSAQLVYLRIFKQPLLWEAIFRGGGDALTNYWREALDGVLGALPFLLLLFMPGVAIGIVFHKTKWQLPQFSGLQVMRTAVMFAVGIAGCIVTLEVGKTVGADFYEEYDEFFDPLGVTETMGVLTTLQRDTASCVSSLAENFFAMEKKVETGAEAGTEDGETGIEADSSQADLQNPQEEQSSTADAAEKESAGQEGTVSQETGVEGQDGGEGDGQAASGQGGSGDGTSGNPEDAAQETPHPQQFTIDYEVLHALADNEKQLWLADYIEGLTPTSTNEYTGIFEGYNLIYLTAEGFCSYAVREDLTPTLYRLTHSGFVFENYYVPLWQTSTSDGEYINCTGLIPDGQFSMRKSGSNNMAYTLPRFFAGEDVTSYAYHNNSLSYYDRYITHSNLGYDFKACRLGNLSAEEWGNQIFPMEHPDQWPASDLEMMQGTVPEYVDEERFHVYYMTVSGHMNYNFKGNAMSAKNSDAVENLEMSENARAYIACNIELDKALEYLLEQLEAAGQLEKTVICLSADHYPYAMTTEQYEELAGKSLSQGMDLYRNSLILWNAGMEEEPVYVTKACGSMDIVPTLLNLFGFPYDSRMYAGRDIFSREEGLVIFNDRSFVTDSVIYNKKAKQTIWLQDAEGNDIVPVEQQEAYLDKIKQEVKDRYQFSAYILQENYYQDVEEARMD